MADTTLTAFVESSLRAGASRGEIESTLTEAGWSRDQVGDALESFADVDFVVPVPRPKAQVSARDAFLYLVMFATLYLSAYHLGSMFFQFVNLAVPDELSDNVELIQRQIRFAAAAIVVAFPIFFYASYRSLQDVALDPTRRASAVRRWLTYLTLFIAAAVIVGDLISLVYNLLSGDLTVRFLLKTLIVALIAGAVFGYYLWLTKTDSEALER